MNTEATPTNPWVNYFTSNCPSKWRIEDLSTTDRRVLDELYNIKLKCSVYKELPRIAQRRARFLIQQILETHLTSSDVSIPISLLDSVLEFLRCLSCAA